MKKFLTVCLCLGLAGCASYNNYSLTYQTAVKAKASTVISKEGDYQQLKTKIAGYFADRGYTVTVYADEKNRFFVFSKEGMFQEPCQIILKYTVTPNENTIRIDLVKQSDNIVSDSQVNEDINEIADQIKNN